MDPADVVSSIVNDMIRKEPVVHVPTEDQRLLSHFVAVMGWDAVVRDCEVGYESLADLVRLPSENDSLFKVVEAYRDYFHKITSMDLMHITRLDKRRIAAKDGLVNLWYSNSELYLTV